MHLHDQPIRPRRNARRGHRRHQIRMARAMARIDHHRQMRAGMQPRHRCQRQREAGVRFKRADAPLAEHHLPVAPVENVFGRQQEFLHRRRRAALQQHRHLRAAHRLQQPVVLHIASPHLQHIGIAGHQRHILGRDHLRHNRQPRLPPRLGKQFQPLLLHPLKAVGTRAGLEGAAAQSRGSECLHLAGRLHNLFKALHRTGTGNHADRGSSYHQRSGPHHCRLRLHLATGHLVRRQDRHHGGHAGERLKSGAGRVAFVPHHSHHRAFGADDHMRPQPQALHPLHDAVDVGLGCVCLHDDDHGDSLAGGIGESENTAGSRSPRRATAARVVIRIVSLASRVEKI